MQAILNFYLNLPVYVYLICSASSVILGDFFAKSWSVSHKPVHFALALAGYLFSGVFYIPSLLKEQLVITSVVWSLLSMLGFLVIGYAIFNESFTPMQIVGIVCGLVSIIILATAG